MTSMKPTPAQVREAAAAGRAYAETGAGDWNPYAGGDTALLARVWNDAHQAAAGGRTSHAEQAERFAALGIEHT